MDTAIAELAQLQPPSEDGAISRALTDLNSKIDAWTEAVAQAQDRIASDFEGIAELLEETAAAAGAPATSNQHSESIAAAHTEIEDSIEANVESDETESTDVEEFAPSEPEAVAVEDDDVPMFDPATLPTASEAVSRKTDISETGDQIEAMLAEFPPDVAERLKIMHATDESRRTMAEIINAYQKEMKDADALLSDMDPEAAQAIRVQYRLFNGRKSIRELVDAYRPTVEEPSGNIGKKKRSWWRS